MVICKQNTHHITSVQLHLDNVQGIIVVQGDSDARLQYEDVLPLVALQLFGETEHLTKWFWI